MFQSYGFSHISLPSWQKNQLHLCLNQSSIVFWLLSLGVGQKSPHKLYIIRIFERQLFAHWFLLQELLQ